MSWLRGSAAVQSGSPTPRPVLHLSGPKLRAALERLVAGAEAGGGVERWVAGARYKGAVFQHALEAAAGGALDRQTLLALTAMMPTVRRRIGPWLEQSGYETAQALVQRLLCAPRDIDTADARIAAFCEAFPAGREYRYARDLAAELLHWSDPERFPPMMRWIWDRSAGTGVLREIWHDADDPALADIPETLETFLVLRDELAQYLTENGFFRDVLLYVDIVCAQVYASYICEQGGSYLRAEFASEHDPMQYVRRMLGLDGIDLESGATRLKLIDGSLYRIDTAALQR